MLKMNKCSIRTRTRSIYITWKYIIPFSQILRTYMCNEATLKLHHTHFSEPKNHKTLSRFDRNIMFLQIALHFEQLSVARTKALTKFAVEGKWHLYICLFTFFISLASRFEKLRTLHIIQIYVSINILHLSIFQQKLIVNMLSVFPARTTYLWLLVPTSWLCFRLTGNTRHILLVLYISNVQITHRY